MPGRWDAVAQGRPSDLMCFGSRVTVTSKANGQSVQVQINDRGPFFKGRCIDLSRVAANEIGIGGK
jgi:rare lipoprotein A